MCKKVEAMVSKASSSYSCSVYGCSYKCSKSQLDRAPAPTAVKHEREHENVVDLNILNCRSARDQRELPFSHFLAQTPRIRFDPPTIGPSKNMRFLSSLVHRVRVTLHLSIVVVVSGFSVGLEADEPMPRTTYCNPISLPNYPIGRFARNLPLGDTGPDWMWRLGYKQQFRELADVAALWFEGKFYLYPSVDMAWVSDDLGATWTHHPLNIRDVGYAPTIVRHQNRFLLMASNSAVYSSASPLGPFAEVGKIELRRSGNLPDFIDPMLFSDSDQRLYYYWGCSPAGGIWGVELDRNAVTQVIGTPKELIPFDPVKFPWEAVGQWNQNPHVGWMEGAWMLKRGGRYYLTYNAGGTENRTYAMGAYVGNSPLGPFVSQRRNPILRTVDGLVTGTAHGSIIAGPNDELWAFYSIRASVVHAFERRLGMDRAAIDNDGELYVHGATSLPQRLPSRDLTHSTEINPVWLPLNGEMRTLGSSNSPNLEGRFAVDNDLKTWWQPDMNDAMPTLTSDFMLPSTIHAVRVIWRDIGLDTSNGITPGPYRYRIEIETSPDKWTTIIDRSQNIEDLLIDYRECKPAVGAKARLVVLHRPPGITPGVTEFSVFGQTN